MPAQEIRNLTQTALLWPALPQEAVDQWGQRQTGFVLQQMMGAMPQELSPRNRPPNGVRWVDKRSVIMAKDGSTIAIDAQVVVAQDIPVNSILWLGTLDDWFGTGSGITAPDEGLVIVRGVTKTPDIKGRAYYRTLAVQRWHNQGGN